MHPLMTWLHNYLFVSGDYTSPSPLEAHCTWLSSASTSILFYYAREHCKGESKAHRLVENERSFHQKSTNNPKTCTITDLSSEQGYTYVERDFSSSPCPPFSFPSPPLSSRLLLLSLSSPHLFFLFYASFNILSSLFGILLKVWALRTYRYWTILPKGD